MEDGKNITATLDSISSKTQSIREEIEALSGSIEAKKAVLNEGDEAFTAELKRLKTEVENRTLSFGDSVMDYVLANYAFYEHERFSDKFGKHVKELKSLLKKLSAAKSFWHHKSEPLQGPWRPEADIYEILFLGETPYAITPAGIEVHGNSSLRISLETVFLDEKTKWPFAKQSKLEKELVVRPTSAEYSYTVPALTDQQCDTNCLEQMLTSKPPLVLATFRRALGQAVSPELEARANQYVHQVAVKAFNQTRRSYLDVLAKDKKILEIEAKYTAPQQVTEMCATRPVIPDPEPEPFMAAILSSDFKSDRDMALKRLVSCIHDLDRTDLVNYSAPLEEIVGVGQKTVANLAEYARHIRGVLELGYKPQ